MKKMMNKKLIILANLLFIVILFGCSSAKHISTTATPQEITSAIKNNHWTFVADYAMPVYGRSRNLSGDTYFVKCSGDSLTVALPYYGKVNSPAGGYGGNPLDFESPNISLLNEDRAKGGWEISIKPNNPEVQSMTFTFFDNGSAQLNITMSNRTGINFSGKVGPTRSA